jgi:hypothetical protein
MNIEHPQKTKKNQKQKHSPQRTHRGTQENQNLEKHLTGMQGIKGITAKARCFYWLKPKACFWFYPLHPLYPC